MPFLLALLVIAIDQLLKIAVTRFLFLGESTPLIKDIFHLTLVQNKGAAFGILKNETYLFAVLSIIAISAIIYSLPRLAKHAVLSRIALALILGGAVGNLLDRIRFGYVIDFLDFRIWPVFNIADSAITVGAILFTIELLRKK